MGKEWYFYIVKCKDNSFYSGIAIDVKERVLKHNKGAGAKYTRAHKPVTLVYSEKHTDFSEARKRESQVKNWPRSKKEQLIMGVQHLSPEKC
jgi:putative endonuclease